MKNAVDPFSNIVTAGPFRLGGWAEGTYIEVDRSVDAFTEVVGADGEVARAYQRNRSGVITLTFLQSSQSNRTLDNFRLLDETARAGIFPFLAKDLSSGLSLVFSASAYVRRAPKQGWSQNVETRIWTIVCPDLDIRIEGPDNL